MKFKKMVTLISITSMFFAALPKTTYADTINLKNLSSDKKVSYEINGKKIKSKYPGIIINGISLADAKDVFSKSQIGLSYKIKNKNITFKGKGKKLVLKLNSNVAKLDGVNVNLPLAPRTVSFSKKISRVYVPARFVAQSFDFTYDWNSSAGIASITGKTIKKKAKKKAKNIKNVKRVPKIKKNAKKANTFKYKGKTYNIGKKVIFKLNGSALNSNKLPGVYIGKTLFAPAKPIFSSKNIEVGYKYNKKNKSVKLSFEDDIISLKLKSKSASFNKTKIKLENAPDLIKFKSLDKSEVYIPVKEVLDIFDIKLKKIGNIGNIILPDQESDQIMEDDEIEDEEDNEENTPSKKTDIKKSDDTEKTKPNETDINNKKEHENNKNTPAEIQDPHMPFSWTSRSQINLASFNPVQTLHGITGLIGSKLLGINNTASNLLENFETYEITSSIGFSDVTGNFNANKLELKCANIISDALQPNITSKIVSSVNFETTGNDTNVIFDLTNGVSGYEMFLSPDKKTLILKIYKNTITEITATNSGDIYKFTFTGVSPLEVKSEDISENQVKFTFQNVLDTIGAMVHKNKVLSLSYAHNGNMEVSVTKPDNYGYYLQQSGNSVNIIFSKKTELLGSAKINLPHGIDISQITDEDNYFDNNFTITIPGDLREYFNNSPIVYDSEKVKNVTTSLDSNGNTVLTFSTTKLYAYKLHKSASQIRVDIAPAKELYSKVVVVDPGHGAHDNGTESFNGIYKEKNIALAIGYTYFKNYLNDDDLKVYWTRKGDTFMELVDRARFADRVGADLFISVHLNAFKREAANGTEVWYSSRNNQIQSNGLSSYAMAGMFLKNITTEFVTRNRGVKNNIFVVTNMNTVPAVLLEYGFLTNNKDLNKFKKLENQDRAAKVLYDTIQEVFAAYPTGRTALKTKSSPGSIKIMSNNNLQSKPIIPDAKKFEEKKNVEKPQNFNSGRNIATVDINKEMRAAWITFLEFSDKGYTKDGFTARITEMFDYIKDSGLNTVYAHVRPFSDAFYKSMYFPWSKYVSGKQGVDPGFDPLAIMVAEAHKRNLKIHAYINPYRVCTTKDFKEISTDSPAYKWLDSDYDDRNVLKYNGMYYYNPASADVVDLVNNGVKEIVDNYAVDGIIFDDYFYPNLGKSYKKNFDAPEYKDYVDECDDEPMSIVAWRRENVNKMVRKVYSTIKNKNNELTFGISPAGNLTNLRANNRYYVDIDKWCSTDGFIDYIAPQQYWGFENKSCPFEGNVNKWRNVVTNPNVKLYFALPIHLAQAQETSEWKDNHDIIGRMITSLREKSLTGFSIYRYDYMTPKYLKKDGAMEEYENMLDAIEDIE